MNTQITKTSKNKQMGALLAACGALFAFILLIIPTQVARADSGSGDYGYGTSDYGWDTPSSYTGSGDYSYDTGYNTYSGSGDYSYDTSYDTPMYSYSSSPSYESYSSPSYYSSYSGGSSYVPMTYVPSSSGSGTNVNVSSNKNANNNTSKSTSVSSNSTSNSSNNYNNSSSKNNINVVVYANSGTSTYAAQGQVTTPTLSGYCTISPSSVSVNQDVTFIATANGGTGSYIYNWSGSDGLSSNSQTFTGRFGTPGTKQATVTIQSGNQVVTAACNVNVNQYNYNYPPVYNNNNMSAYCQANPTYASAGQTVTWQVYVNGSNYGNNTYSWSGTDGLYGYGQSVPFTYNTAGTKQAYVTVYSNGQQTTAVCSTNIQGSSVSNVTVYRQPTSGTPVSGVFLSQVPATGIDWNLKTTLFALGLIIWSAFIAYFMIARRKSQVALATVGASKEESFKIANMQKKGIIA